MKKELLTIMVVILSFGNGYSQKSGKDDTQKKLQEVQELPCQTCNVVCNDKLHYFRLYSENDFWKLRGTTDRYFTNGIKVEYFFLPPGTRKGLLDRVFPNLPYWRDKEKKLKNDTRNNNFSIAFGMNQYTPVDLSRTTVDSADRPYAGWMFFAARCISNDYGTAERITTEYSAGVIGPSAQQKYVQTKWHEIFDFQKPMGWDNQIKNNLAVNINVQYERGIVNPTENIEIIGGLEANIGTVTNYAGIGGTIRLGRFNDYFINEFGLTNKSQRIRYDSCSQHLKRTKKYKDNLSKQFQFYGFVRGHSGL